jgi:hypothetical protein
MYNRYIYFSLFIIFLPFWATAQMNLIVGYDATFKEQREINYAIARYNKETPNLTNKLSSMWHYSGLDLGLRYNFGNFAIESHFLTKFRNTRGTVTENNVKSAERLKLNDQAISFGLASNWKKVGFGAAWEYHRFQFSRKFKGDSDFIKAFPELVYYHNLQVFLDLKVSSNEKISVIFRPYINIGLQGDNISQRAIENVMNLSPQSNSFNRTRWNALGFKFIFLNGRQANYSED